jgi:glutaredoxin 3
MARVEIYTKFLCPYCARAKRLLGDKGVAVEEYEISGDTAKRAEMLGRANGRTTVPQIFIDGQHVGGLGRPRRTRAQRPARSHARRLNAIASTRRDRSDPSGNARLVQRAKRQRARQSCSRRR